MIPLTDYEIKRTEPSGTLSARLPLTERAIVEALAVVEGVTLSKMVRALVVPAAKRALAARASEAGK